MVVKFNPDKHYRSSIQCYKGHEGIWYKKDSRCVQCIQERDRRRYKRNPQADIAKTTQWRKNHPKSALFHVKRYLDRNPGLSNAFHRARHAIKLQAIPKWANLEVIKEIYRNCPDDMTVDHVIPLRSPIVCGLHCEQNLQYLSRSDNSIKGNRLWPDMP